MLNRRIVLGLRANWQQFTLLMIINAFVGAMVGLERTVVPRVAQSENARRALQRRADAAIHCAAWRSRHLRLVFTGSRARATTSH
jgi:hypothetical protein